MANGPSTATMDTTIAGSPPNGSSNPTLVLEPLNNNNNFAIKSLELLPENSRIKIGRQTSVATAPNPTNGYFDSKVLSRIHAEVWSDQSKVFIRDLKSSNGTFLNGRRLSPENVESDSFVLNQNDHLEFGIDIMDENGSLLHEKVACKIFISRLPYPTPRGSPKESHPKLRSSSPTGSGSSTKSTTAPSAVSGGQSTNIDLIISRLQSELTRSQETNADLGALKQGLGELERAIIAPTKEDGKPSSKKRAEASAQVTPAVDYQKLIEENNQKHVAEVAKLNKQQLEDTQAHVAEVAKLNKQLEDTQAEVEAYIQKIQLLEPLVAEDEILRRDIAQSAAELTKVKLERDLANNSMNDLITEHQQVTEILRKEHEASLAALEAMHKDNLERVARQATLAQELLASKYQEDLAKALQTIPTPPQVEPVNAKELENLQLEVSSLAKEVGILQQTIEVQSREIQEKNTEKTAQAQQLTEAKAEIIRKEKDLQTAKQHIDRQQQDLSTLTPSSPTNIATASICQQCRGQIMTTTPTSSSVGSRKSTKHGFSWVQLMFPQSKQNPQQSSTTMAMSGGVMLVGIGAYILWHKSGLHRNR
ncbi:hypothetical protein BGZ65_007659 [Modicella reniformis]|uniref:FHA domain-containing protein n=1 Tax=Modicella reniformis TaxID=1440133 RepID=A0A9P6JMG4_9FUNG|nr:hypothetical protein BGZ65_007659 [Modicella reniformis]